MNKTNGAETSPLEKLAAASGREFPHLLTAREATHEGFEARRAALTGPPYSLVRQFRAEGAAPRPAFGTGRAAYSSSLNSGGLRVCLWEWILVVDVVSPVPIAFSQQSFEGGVVGIG